jgi:hypothetical protein
MKRSGVAVEEEDEDDGEDEQRASNSSGNNWRLGGRKAPYQPLHMNSSATFSAMLLNL